MNDWVKLQDFLFLNDVNWIFLTENKYVNSWHGGIKFTFPKDMCLTYLGKWIMTNNHLPQVPKPNNIILDYNRIMRKEKLKKLERIYK